MDKKNTSIIVIEVKRCSNETSEAKNITCKPNSEIDSWLNDKVLYPRSINE